jgi:hypothetical protein
MKLLHCNAQPQMLMLTATGQPSSAAFIGIPAKLLQLTGGGGGPLRYFIKKYGYVLFTKIMIN